MVSTDLYYIVQLVVERQDVEESVSTLDRELVTLTALTKALPLPFWSNGAL